MSKINFNKVAFLSKFLTPLSRVADNLALTVLDNSIEAIGSTADGGVIIYASLDVDIDTTLKTLNIPDIKKFARLLDCIPEDDVSLEITSNSLKYHTKEFKFNYFLLEDMYMQRVPIKVEKVKALPYDVVFELTTAKLAEVLRGSSVAADSDKLYFYQNSDGIYAEINDLERHNINSVSYHIADGLQTGDLSSIKALPLNLDSVRLLAGIKTPSFIIKINTTLKVAIFEVVEDGLNIKFVISGLVK